jgi:hypothetical protein
LAAALNSRRKSGILLGAAIAVAAEPIRAAPHRIASLLNPRTKEDANRRSHIVSIQTRVRNPAAVAAACHRMSLPAPAAG